MWRVATNGSSLNGIGSQTGWPKTFSRCRSRITSSFGGGICSYFGARSVSGESQTFRCFGPPMRRQRYQPSSQTKG